MPRRILIIDDEEILRFALRLTLSTAGYDAYCAQDRQSAMEICHQASPDLVILDYRMPDMNGLELARLLRDVEPPVRIALCSAHIDDHNMLEALSLGIVDFIPKPVLPQELREIVTQILSPPTSDSPPLAHLLDDMRNGRFSAALKYTATLARIPDHQCLAQAWRTVIESTLNGEVADAAHFSRSNVHDLLFR